MDYFIEMEYRKTTLNGIAKGVEMRGDIHEQKHEMERNEAKLEKLYSKLLTSVEGDVKRQGLTKTPQRAAKALLYFTKGYDESVAGKSTWYVMHVRTATVLNFVSNMLQTF